MNSNVAEVVGYAAALLTTVSFAPQVLKTWKSRSARDLSIGMLLTFSVGVFLWLIYGLTLGSMPVIGANAVTLVQAVCLIVLRVRYGHR